MTDTKRKAIGGSLQKLQDIHNVTLLDFIDFMAREKQLLALVRSANAYTVFSADGPTVISEVGEALESFKAADLRADVARTGGEDWELKFFGGLAEGKFTEGPFELPRPQSPQIAPLMEDGPF
jgi:hypothetical protein